MWPVGEQRSCFVQRPFAALRMANTSFWRRQVNDPFPSWIHFYAFPHSHFCKPQWETPSQNLVRTFDVYRLYKVIPSFLLHLTCFLILFIFSFFSPRSHFLPTLKSKCTDDYDLWAFLSLFQLVSHPVYRSTQVQFIIDTLLFKIFKQNTQLSLSTSCTPSTLWSMLLPPHSHVPYVPPCDCYLYRENTLVLLPNNKN